MHIIPTEGISLWYAVIWFEVSRILFQMAAQEEIGSFQTYKTDYN